MIIQIKAKHYRNTYFSECLNCAISKAVRDALPLVSRVNEGVTNVKIDGKQYEHDPYWPEDFRKDQDEAKKHNWDEIVIREIEIQGL
jgi:hypothetical protein